MKVTHRELDLVSGVIRMTIEVPLDEAAFVHLRGLNANMDVDRTEDDS